MTNNELVGGIRYSVEPYAHCREVVAQLRNATRPTMRDAAYLAWRYEGRPCAEPAQASIAWDGARPVGALCAIPHDFFVLDRIAPIGVLGDFSVLSEYRGRGIADGIVAALRAAECARRWRGLFALPNRAAEGAFRRNGFALGRGVGRHVRLLSTREQSGLRRTAAGLAARLMAPVFRDYRGKMPTDLEFRCGHGFDARHDRLWERLPKDGRIISVRNAAYLRWRFERHPLHRFQTFELARDAELCGYFTLHVESATAVVDDFCALDRPSADVLLRQVLRELRRSRDSGRFALQVSQGFWPAMVWSRYGFFAREDRQSSAWTLSDGAPPVDPAVMEMAWHVTMADKDV